MSDNALPALSMPAPQEGMDGRGAHAPVAPLPGSAPALPLDWNRLHMAAVGDKDKASLLALFFRLAIGSVATMDSARRNNDFEQWKIAARHLLGSASNLGMPALAALCTQAEKGAALTYDQRSSLLQRIREELERINAYIIHQNPSLFARET